MEIRDAYSERVNTLTFQIAKLRRKKKLFGLGRLVSFLAAILLFFILLLPNHIAAVSAAILCLVIFLILALRDLDNMRALRYHELLLEINEQELAALEGNIENFEDGAAFTPRYHDYALDLDIFGPHSIYQFLNRTTAAPSSALLAERLLGPLEPGRITAVQDAVRELSGEVDWRQQLQARGRLAHITREAYRQIGQWSSGKEELTTEHRALAWITRILPFITLGLIILAWSDVVSWKILWLSFCAHLLVTWRVEKATDPLYQGFSDAIKVMEGFNGALKTMTGKTFKAALLREIQQGCFQGTQAPTVTFRRLKRILGRMDIKLNMLMHFPLNLATFWDWHQFAQLGRWKRNNPGTLLKWLDAFREMEVLSCFANAAYNHPGWVFPEVMESGDFVLNAKTLGHPLLREDHRVCNDLQMEGKGRILLVTGSNMAGKSTFLRTVGINMVLALAGGPACAEKMQFSRAHVISSMRIADNLEENISTFYAELKKLEIILKKVRAHEPVFLLLDEILRGTNSLDRHAGARALIRTFVEEGAVGILATHDLELTGMEKELPEALVNYHFDVQVQAEELFFDYKLKPGICTSMNASLLMRKIGIEV